MNDFLSPARFQTFFSPSAISLTETPSMHHHLFSVYSYKPVLLGAESTVRVVVLLNCATRESRFGCAAVVRAQLNAFHQTSIPCQCQTLLRHEEDFR